MTNPVSDAKQSISVLVSAALNLAVETGALPACDELPPFVVEIPADTSHGDFATNAAMVWARAFKCAPRKVAQEICANLKLDGSGFDRVEIAGPGFINFFLGAQWFADVVTAVLSGGERYGRTDFGKGEKVQVEFVSANPTGPMHMGNARGGAIGDCLAAALDWSGHEVTREFYINDAGNQIEKFGLSLDARYLQIFKGEEAVVFPEDGYHGEDIKLRAQEFADIHGDKFVDADEAARKKALIDFALPKNIEKLQKDLESYRISYDVWFRESTLHPDAINMAIKAMRERGMIYENEGALWYKATENGGEKDEVLVRANGYPTYFAADIAYHYNKFAVRGFDRVINVWGADHHGHVARLKGAMDAVGLDGDKLDIVLMQLVRLTKDGKPFKMSKRTGKAVSLTDLIDEVPVDAARFFFNMREPNSSLDFDLDLAVSESSQNPVYYVQYAHARICSILRKLSEEGITPRKCTSEELRAINTSEELELIRRLARFPQEIIDAAKNYDPARLTKYAIDAATDFHKYYNACRVKDEAEPLMQARLNLCIATKTVLYNVLTLLKITVPETM
ncbi:arginine--tRNA ligase [Oscillospiraceae bacterium PP1C4]